MQSNTNIIMVWPWMLWSSDAVENERSHGLGMDALVDPPMQSNMTTIMVLPWMLWSSDAVEHENYYGYSGHWTQSNTNVIMVWAWMVWSSDAVKHECCYGLGMDTLVIRCSCTLALCWFGHGCSGHRRQSSMNVIVG